MWFDGGCRDGVSGAGVLIEGCRGLVEDGCPNFVKVIQLSFRVQHKCGSSEAAEAVACLVGLAGVLEICTGCSSLVVDSYCKLRCSCDAARAILDACDAFLLNEGG